MGDTPLPFELKNFLKEDFVALAIVGASGSGKTTLCEYFINNLKNKFQYIYLYTGSEINEDNSYLKTIWKSNIKVIPGDTKEKKQKIKYNIEEQITLMTNLNNSIKNKNKNLEQMNEGKKIPTVKTLIISDDLNNANGAFEEIITKSRHAGISFIFLLHADKNFPPSMRDAIESVFINVHHPPTHLFNKYDKSVLNKYEEFRNNIIVSSAKNKSLNKVFLTIDKGIVKSILLEDEDINPLKDSPAKYYSNSLERIKYKKLLKDLYNLNIEKKL